MPNRNVKTKKFRWTQIAEVEKSLKVPQFYFPQSDRLIQEIDSIGIPVSEELSLKRLVYPLSGGKMKVVELPYTWDVSQKFGDFPRIEGVVGYTFRNKKGEVQLRLGAYNGHRSSRNRTDIILERRVTAVFRYQSLSHVPMIVEGLRCVFEREYGVYLFRDHKDALSISNSSVVPFNSLRGGSNQMDLGGGYSPPEEIREDVPGGYPGERLLSGEPTMT